MTTVLYILLAILIFGFLIFIHEFGHFLAAKLFKVQVNEFSINMGPKLLQKQWGETKYSLRLIPIGGYCAMEGEDEDTGNPHSFTAAKWWKRIIILCAGSFMNLLTGFVIMALVIGLTYGGIRTLKLSGFMDGCTLCGEEGLQEGDEIYAIDGRRTYLYSDFSMLVDRSADTTYDLTVIRNGEKVTLHDFKMEKQELTDDDGNTGLYYGFYFGDVEKISFFNTFKYAGYYCIDFTRMVWYGLSDLVTGRASINDMSGVVGIVDVMVQTGEEAPTVGDAIGDIFLFAALIAVNLAVMNMLPIPALDGGRVFFLLISTAYTAITKKKINPKYEGYIHAAGMILLLGLMGFLIVKDIVMIASR